MADYFGQRKHELRIKPPQTPRSFQFAMPWDDEVPIVDDTDTFSELVTKFIGYIHRVVEAAYTYEQLRTTFDGQSLRPLILRLSDECHHPAVVAALLAAKYIFVTTDDEGTGLSGSRGLACEIIAWQFLTLLSEKELVDYLLFEVPDVSARPPVRRNSTASRAQRTGWKGNPDEHTPLLQSQSPSRPCDSDNDPSHPPQPTIAAPSADATAQFDASDAANVAAHDDTLKSLAGMNALEVAGIASAKTFLRQRPVQRIIDDIWSGKVMFWESLSVEAVRRPHVHHKKIVDPFIRLRVPRYQKAFQVGFFLSFLVLFYAVLMGRDPQRITATEALLYVWIAAYAYDELGEVQDTGMLFYRVDFWSLWDVGIIGVSLAFVVMRIVGLVKGSDELTGMAFDVLSMVALFLVPRIFSVMSLNPYFGSLIPVLKEMTKTFLMFLPVILVLYLGFLTTFTMLARDKMEFREVSWILVNVFFGSSFLGLDVSFKISPHFGYPLMLIFVCLTNILLITSLVSLVSNSLAEVMAHARTEYLFQYSIYVLESSSSRRLTYFMPPLNLIPLLLLRPLRLLLPSEQLRRVRIILLKATHVAFVALIWAYEASIRLVTRGNHTSSTVTRDGQGTPRPLSAGLQIERERYARRPCPVSALTKPTFTKAPIDSASGIADADVVKLIQKLSTQVEELSALVTGQQRGGNA